MNWKPVPAVSRIRNPCTMPHPAPRDWSGPASEGPATECRASASRTTRGRSRSAAVRFPRVAGRLATFDPFYELLFFEIGQRLDQLARSRGLVHQPRELLRGLQLRDRLRQRTIAQTLRRLCNIGNRNLHRAIRRLVPDAHAPDPRSEKLDQSLHLVGRQDDHLVALPDLLQKLRQGQHAPSQILPRGTRLAPPS